MTRTRTVPGTSPAITQDTIESVVLVIGRSVDGTINSTYTKLEYNIANRLADGTIVSRPKETQVLSAWTAALQTGVEAMYDAILVDAEAKGHIGAGTDTDDLP